MSLVEIASNCFEMYRTFGQEHSHLCAMATMEATLLTGDCVSQVIQDRKIDPKKLKYTAALAPLYGLGLEAVVEAGELVGRHIIDHPLAKAALGPNLWGNGMNAFFFMNNTIGEREGYSLRALGKKYKALFENDGKTNFFGRLKNMALDNIPGKQFAYATIATLTVWNGLQWLNYEYVEEAMRTPATIGAAFIWGGVLSAWSLKGRREKVNKMPLES